MSEKLTPAEFLRLQQAEHPIPVFDERYFSDYLRKQLEKMPDLAARIKQEKREDYALHLLCQLKPRLPELLRQVLETNAVAIGEINDHRPNARCQPLGPGRFAVTFNSGLKDFNYRVIRAFSTRFATPDKAERETVSFEDTCRIIGDIFLWFNETGLAHGPYYPITDDQFRIANLLTLEANSFFLAHELAHGAIHLSQSECSNESAAADDSKDEEYLADELACLILLNRPEAPSNLPPVEVSYAAIELALMIWQGLEQFGVEFEGTHPTAGARLSFIRRVLVESCPSPETAHAVAELAEPMRIVFERVLDEIRMPNYEVFLDRAANQWLCELDTLLDRCTGGMVPDYMTFYGEANRLFNHGFSLKLSQRMAAVAGDFFEKMKRIPDEHNTEELKEIWIASQKYKLFFGFIRELPAEIRKVFEGSLGTGQEN